MRSADFKVIARWSRYTTSHTRLTTSTTFGAHGYKSTSPYAMPVVFLSYKRLPRLTHSCTLFKFLPFFTPLQFVQLWHLHQDASASLSTTPIAIAILDLHHLPNTVRTPNARMAIFTPAATRAWHIINTDTIRGERDTYSYDTRCNRHTWSTNGTPRTRSTRCKSGSPYSLAEIVKSVRRDEEEENGPLQSLQLWPTLHYPSAEFHPFDVLPV
jgi:hypothetical protein